MFDKVNQLKEKLDSKRPLPTGMVKNLREVIRIEWTYNSNAIEGNTLSLLETKMVVEEGLTIGGKRLKEHFEAINHAEAIDFVEELVGKQEPLTERILKQIHYLVLKNIDNENAGKYRGYNVGISGSIHNPVNHVKVPEEMEQLFAWYRENETILHPVELASMFHFKLVFIHPFIDGNGRTARLGMNLILMQHGYPPAIIKAKPEQRIKYYECLEKASVDMELTPFIRLVTDCVEESLQHYLNAIG
ncbi:Fic family protein [Fodinisporobacter ferrooxydans]|uniref:Fic family protein n=1 Tax=Fodinisporobacter ferrooxydans TaxID=2901836 RepID=A0ABY4CH94_9BACL|nr:Fic family protein [Alicyclobacillaceae bacterium MYW30-H2]